MSIHNIGFDPCPQPLLILSQSDSLIQIADINSHTEWQTVQIQISWLLRSQLIWIYTVCKDRVFPGSAERVKREIRKLFCGYLLLSGAILHIPAVWLDPLMSAKKMGSRLYQQTEKTHIRHFSCTESSVSSCMLTVFALNIRTYH